MAQRTQHEAAEQRALAQWLDLCGAAWCHVPNGGARNAWTGAELKRQGVKRGVPDVLIFSVPEGSVCVGVAVELKAGRGSRVSQEQELWHRRLRQTGWVVIVANGAPEAIAELRRLGYDPRAQWVDRGGASGRIGGGCGLAVGGPEDGPDVVGGPDGGAGGRRVPEAI